MAVTIFRDLFKDSLKDNNAIELLFSQEIIEAFKEGRKKIKSRDPHERIKAELQLIEAAEEGVGAAQRLLKGIYLRRSEDEKADIYGKLSSLYEQAHESDAEDDLSIQSDSTSVDAQYELGLRYLHGNGVKQNINRSAVYFTAAARAGNLLAIEQLIKIYRDNLLPIESDDHKQTIIQRWTTIYKLLTIENYDLELDIQYKIALGYYKQDGEYSEYCIKNLNQAFKLFLLAATKGHQLAQQMIIEMYKNKQIVKQNHKEAFDYFLSIAKQGNLIAQQIIIEMYRNGQGIARNFKKSLAWGEITTLHQKANNNDANSQYQLGLHYLSKEKQNDCYFITNPDKAFCYLLSAAMQGHTNAQQKVAQMYETGQGTTKDLNQARNWNWLFEIHQSANNGDVMAQHDIANKVYLSGFKHKGTTYIVKDEAKAYDYILLAARNGYLPAQQQLAKMYETGQGVEQNSHRAEKWDYLAELHEAALSSSCKPLIIFQLGLEYMQEGLCGRYLKQNSNKALEYFLMAAKQGSLLSQERVAIIYEKFASQETNEENKKRYATEAVIWRDLLSLEQEAANGNPNAQYTLGIIYSGEVDGGFNSYINKNEAKALSLFDQAATQGHSLAKVKVGQLFTVIYSKKFSPKYRVGQAGNQVKVADEHYNEADCARVQSMQAYKKILTCYPR